MTEQTFKVGDKVRHRDFGDGELTYGPFLSRFSTSRFLMLLSTGAESEVGAHNLTALPVPPTFAVGDKVDHRTFGAGTVAFGPFKYHRGPDHYLIVTENGSHALSSPDALTAAKADAIKVGDRVEVLVDDPTVLSGEFMGLTGQVTEIGGNISGDPDRYRVKFESRDAKYVAWWCNKVRKVDGPADGFEYEGDVYEYGVKYSDSDGDAYEFKSELSGPGTRDHNNDGTPIGRIVGRSSGNGEPGAWYWSLAEVVDAYGPLTRV